MQKAREHRRVELHRLAPEQILHLHILDVSHTHAATHHFINLRQHTHAATGLLTNFKNCFLFFCTERRNRKDDLVDISLPCCVGDLFASAHNGYAAEESPPFGAVIVDHAAYPTVCTAVARALADEHTSCLTCTDEHNALFISASLAIQRTPKGIIEPQDAALTGQQRHLQHKRDELHTAWHSKPQQDAQSIADHAGKRGDKDHLRNILCAHRAPDIAIHPKQRKHHDRQYDLNRQELQPRICVD